MIFNHTHTVEFYKDTRRQWRWRAAHRNGNIVATSGESYHNLDDCKVAVKNLFKAARFWRVRYRNIGAER